MALYFDANRTMQTAFFTPKVYMEKKVRKTFMITILEGIYSEPRVLYTTEFACTQKPSSSLRNQSSYKPVEIRARRPSDWLKVVSLHAKSNSIKAWFFLVL